MARCNGRLPRPPTCIRPSLHLPEKTDACQGLGKSLNGLKKAIYRAMKAHGDIKNTPDVGHLELGKPWNEFKTPYDANDQKWHNRTNTNTQQLKNKTLKIWNTKDTTGQIRAHLCLNGSGCNCVHVCCRLDLQLLLQIYWCKICTNTYLYPGCPKEMTFRMFLESRCKRSITSTWHPSQPDKSLSRNYFLVLSY